MKFAPKRSQRALSFCLAIAMSAGTACSHAATDSAAQTAVQSASPSATDTTLLATQTSAPIAATIAQVTSGSSNLALTSSGDADFGPDTIEDGIVKPSSDASAGSGTKSIGVAAASLLSSGPAPAASATPDALVTLAQRAEDALPAAQYSLAALAQTLPTDPSALDTFVRDNIVIDLYDGVLRGALGAWLGRAANPTDKLLLLASQLRAKHIAFTFVRGTLSDSERATVIDEAKRSPRFIVEPTDPRVRTYVESRAAAGRRFAAWITPKLGSAIAPQPDAVAAAHYWIRTTDVNGKQLDLDPTLKTTAPGTHLGTEDTTVKPSTALPQGIYATVDVRLRATDTAGIVTTVLEATAPVADIALAPIQVILQPADSGNAVTAMLLVGTRSIATKQIPPGTASHVDLEVTRTSTAGVRSTLSRAVFDQHRDGGDLASRGLGIHTIVVCPESAPAFIAHVGFGDASVLARGATLRRSGQDAGNVGFYPKPIADFIAIDDIMAATLGTSAGVRLFRDRPDIVMLHTTAQQTGTSETTVRTTFDIGDNGMAAAGDKGAEIAANLARGWADTRIEKDLMLAHGDSAMDRWLEAKAQRTGFALTSSPPTASSFAGGVAVAPTGSGADAVSLWWDVDAATGSAVGRSPGGYGDAAETGLLIRAVSFSWRGIKLGWTLFGIYTTAASCLKELVSADCAIGIVGVVGSGIGAAASISPNWGSGAVGAAAIGKMGLIYTGGSWILSNDVPPAPHDPNAPNACGMVCAPGDPDTSDGDGP